MRSNLLLRSLLILFVSFASFVLILPNYIERSWLPNSKINLGLDLQGGSHLLLEVDFDTYVKYQLANLANMLRKSFRDEKLGYKNLNIKNQILNFEVRDESELEKIEKVVKNLDRNLVFAVDKNKISVFFSDYKLVDLQDKVIDQSLEIVRMRVDSEGTKEPIIQRQGNQYILLQVPGAEDPNVLKNILGKTAKLTFHLVDDSADLSQALNGHLHANQLLVEGKSGEDKFYVVVFKHPDLTGDMLIDAQTTFNQNGQPAVSFELNALGSRIFADLTKNNPGRGLAIVLDGKLLSAPSINEPINGGRGIISGSFTVDSASELALLLRAGALPAPLQIIEERTVGPNLGSDSIVSGKKAAIIGISSVMIFMVWIYGIFGVFANIALVIGLSFIIGLIGLIGATLTLPGIAGIILTVGMAVDANILIYERIREEVQKGVSKYQAVNLGFDSAFGTIADSNITTLIAALLLYIFGSGVIKGFAVTLSIGILASMFSAIVITKLLVDLWLRYAKKTAQINF
jgi:preprotein translocase subunit SecD